MLKNLQVKYEVLHLDSKTKEDQNANEQDEMVSFRDKPDAGMRLRGKSGFYCLIHGTRKPGFESRGSFRAHDDRLIKGWLQA